ncbi:MAG: bifunctional diaminohydroxyphosphoribosylaminopyrimidine deaminase/5-amino-6-(5-phosphoribosylamino)uracil reductase RibD [Rhodospirillales bacterium]|nr:bifunctional diaminohydroxyphosphoribosylaminopyrimidine deaminase/5-amino-6-(5-phosphoribosylamino)uracil reductase RibD [Rhodospirillales bacterium]
MRAALGLARRNLGCVWPNPAVGCVLVRDGAVVGRGWTGRGGRPHAETEALARAGCGARGATAHVSLEPCDHHGETPPCSEALIAAGVARVVVAVEDPDPRVSGRGIQRLRAAGIDVQPVGGALAEEARNLNAGFFLRVREGRPLFTLKTATTLDGKIATRSGDSRWITGAGARALTHGMRAEHDAVLVGSNTALLDDPELTCRTAGMEHRSPVRIVVDGRLRLPPEARLAATAREVSTWVLTRADAPVERREQLAAAGAVVIDVAADAAGRLDPVSIAQVLARRGLTRVLIEGGGTVAASFLAAGLIDRVAWFRAPLLFGEDAQPAVAALAVERLADALRFVREDVRTVGSDVLETYRRSV